MVEVVTLTGAMPAWQAYVEHLARVQMLPAAPEQRPQAECCYLGVLVGAQVVGHLAIRRQALAVPASRLTNGQEHLLNDAQGQPLYEAFVQTFGVEAAYRRQGYGRALQLRGLEQARAWGCWQMRSWSSADKAANYALKISLGYVIQPALYPLPGGAPISGVYFIKSLLP